MESITKELREWFESGYVYKHYDDGDDDFKKIIIPWFGWRIVIEDMLDHIDEAYKKAVRELNDYASDSVLLPRDADGVPIRVGDMIAYKDNTKPKEVVALVPPDVVMVEDGPRYADMCCHHHEPTVEDVLEELLREYDRDDSELTDGEIVERFAKRLQLSDAE